MPFGMKPKCTMCKCVTSPMWHKNKEDEVVCNSCFLKSSTTTTATSDNKNIKSCPFNLRRSTRAKSLRCRQGASKTSTKGKSRRNIFKKVCMKAPTSVSTTVTAQSLFYKGIYYQVGDIVSCVDFQDRVYYAQIRGLLQDQYSEKSAVITWLLPTTSSPKGRFDPATYVIGPEEDIPRKLECFEFVCHAPSEYYQAKTSPYPVIPLKPESGFIWTRLGPRIIPLPTREEVFGTK